MKQVLMARGARVLVETCANVKKGEKVLVATDIEMISIAETVAGAAYSKGAEVVICVMEPRKVDGQEPPEAVAEAMKASDVIFAPVAKSITHTNASKNALKAGSRAIFMSWFTEEMMISEEIAVDYLAQKPIVEEVAKRLSSSETAEVTSEKGTRLKMVTKGRQVNALTGIAHDPGTFSVPSIEANVTPLEGSAEGIIVADGSITGIGALSEPVRLVVEKGNVVSISGGREAQRFRRMIEELNDPNCYNIAELGFGLNPKARTIGFSESWESWLIGTIHIGIGSNIALGGKVKASLHSDCVLWNPTVTLDGRAILRDGELTI